MLVLVKNNSVKNCAKVHRTRFFISIAKGCCPAEGISEALSKVRSLVSVADPSRAAG